MKKSKLDDKTLQRLFLAEIQTTGEISLAAARVDIHTKTAQRFLARDDKKKFADEVAHAQALYVASVKAEWMKKGSDKAYEKILSAHDPDRFGTHRHQVQVEDVSEAPSMNLRELNTAQRSLLATFLKAMMVAADK